TRERMPVSTAPHHPSHTHPTADRSDFRNVLISGTKLGGIITAAVVLYLLVARVNPPVLRAWLGVVLVLAGGTAAAFMPARWCVSRNVEGIAGAAAVGLWGSVVFAVLDIAILRPLH